MKLSADVSKPSKKRAGCGTPRRDSLASGSSSPIERGSIRRFVTAAELARKKNYPGDGDVFDDDRFGYALVRLMSPGHVLIFYIGIAPPEMEPDEANIARLWKIAFEAAAKFAATGLPPGSSNMRKVN